MVLICTAVAAQAQTPGQPESQVRPAPSQPRLPQEQTQWQQQIQRSQIDSMFAEMRAKAPFNVDGPLLWGYYFFDQDRTKLDRAARELAAQNYRVVGVEQMSEKVFRLRVERVEIHTPASLYARNQYFYAMAERLGIDSYDGMDAGPANSGLQTPSR